MSQNTPTENNQPFFNIYSNDLQQINHLDQPSNIFYNENAACSYTNGFSACNNVLPVNHTTDGNIYSTLQDYTTMSSNEMQYNASNGQVVTQNSPQSFMNVSPSPQIITYEIPGY